MIINQMNDYKIQMNDYKMGSLVVDADAVDPASDPENRDRCYNFKNIFANKIG
jgi:hypothetical protein